MSTIHRSAFAFSLIAALVAAAPAPAQIEIEFFERAVTQPDGQPLFLEDLAAAVAVDPASGIFDNGTSITTCCGSFSTLNTIISLSTDSNAITEGTQALNISMTNNDPGNQGTGNTAFDRPAILRITPADPRYADIQTVANNPSNFKMVADITLIASEVPDTFNGEPQPFIRVGFFGNSQGFVEPPELRDALLWDQAALTAMETAGFSMMTLEFPAIDLMLPTAPTAYQLGFVFNGNWELTQRAAFNIDNWRFEAAFVIADLDMDLDTDVDADDFEILMANHLDPNADTFAEGDLDGDGDNDFDDFRFFENGWNTLGAPVPFSALLAGVPEPATIGLFAFGGVALMGMRRRHTVGLSVLLMTTLLFATSRQAEAQLADTVLFDWEDGLQEWEVSGDDALGVTLGNSAIGSTQVGTQSFSIEQPLDGFNWGATNSIFGNVNFDAINNALDIGAEHFVLELDVTYDSPGSIPAGGTFANVAIRFQSSAGSSEIGGLANYDFTSSPQTISISQPLDNWTALPLQSGVTGFFRIDLGLNGDWGFSPGTFYFDNMRLRQVSEPALLTLEVDRSDGSARILNNSGLDGTGVGGAGGTVDINYYQILSDASLGAADADSDDDVDGKDLLELQRVDPSLISDWEAAFGAAGGAGSLNPAGWNSLDNQDVDAVDGPDPGSVAGDATFEGWDASGGVDSALAESFFLSSSDLADTESLSLGSPFTVGEAENLQFFYREPGRPDFLREGNVVFVGTAPLGGVTAVPEASAAMLALIGGTILGLGRCRIICDVTE